MKGTGPVTAILHNGSNNLVTLRYRLKDLKFEAIEQAAKAGDMDLPAGTLLVQSSPRVKSRSRKAGPAGRHARRSARMFPKHLVDLPRLAVFTTWGSTQDVGWVRYAFDHFEVAYDLIYKERIKQGNLRASYDVIVIPSQGRGGAKALIFDIDPRGKPPVAYTKSADFPSLGAYGEIGGHHRRHGTPGRRRVRQVRERGRRADHARRLQLLPGRIRHHANRGRRPHHRRSSTRPAPSWRRRSCKPTHPIFYGYTQKIVPVRWASGPLLRVPTESASGS